jgi:hypothetical protein
MYALMCCQTALLTECLITYITCIRALTSMYALMLCQTAMLTECIITHITGIRALTCMNAQMCYEMALITECLTAHLTHIRMFTYVCALMSYQVSGFAGWRCGGGGCGGALTTMYVLMCYLTAVMTECLITHITPIWALTSMYALVCYQISFLTERLITQFTWKCTLTATYITRIPAFIIAYVKLFIHSALVKTQRLYIRIYSDRKNNYFYSNVYIK